MHSRNHNICNLYLFLSYLYANYEKTTPIWYSRQLHQPISSINHNVATKPMIIPLHMKKSLRILLLKISCHNLISCLKTKNSLHQDPPWPTQCIIWRRRRRRRRSCRGRRSLKQIYFKIFYKHQSFDELTLHTRAK